MLERFFLNDMEVHSGHQLDVVERAVVVLDIRGIRKNYRKEKGIVKAMFLTSKKVIKAFNNYCDYEIQHYGTDHLMKMWQKFVRNSIEDGGSEALDSYLKYI